MSDPRCKCTLSVSLAGDGCRYCQPQEHIERMGEWLDEERDEITALHTENKELQAMVSTLVEALETCLEMEERPKIIKLARAAIAAYRKQGCRV